MNAKQQSSKIISVGGGKGGVGKSILAISMGTVLARMGHSVVLVDLDLGAANLHTYLGILRQTPTIANFLLGKTASLEDLIVATSERNLRLISGAEFVPGVTNPAHWMMQKLIRHLRALSADFIIIDLGAGVHFSTLDFFGISNHGVVITAPEPGAVMNAYSFIKGALYRKIQNVFRNHNEISRAIEAESRHTNDEKRFTLEWFRETLDRIAPELLPLISEIEESFRPVLVINRAPEGHTHLLVKNLISLCKEKLAVTLEHVGDLPDMQNLSNHLLNVPRFFSLSEGASYVAATEKIVNRFTGKALPAKGRMLGTLDYSDEELEEILRIIETLDDRVFSAATKNMWKLRLFFKPSDVISFLISRGITHPLFYKSA
ncbi:MAG TPA: P-loop NTPase [Nitrospirota bacterium]|nr:P-loop NTPase [Nitrospirota bacterium]